MQKSQFFHTVDALILECTKEISGNQGNQLIIDCSTNREPNATYCSFDGNSRQECEELYFMVLLVDLVLIMFCFICMTGTYPIAIGNYRELSPGPHSLSITIRDSFGYEAEFTIHYEITDPNSKSIIKSALGYYKERKRNLLPKKDCLHPDVIHRHPRFP